MRRPKGNRHADSDEPVSPELIAACKRGDEEAWAELVRATYREVYTVCLRILRDPDDAAEATQDAYLKAWRGLKGFRGEALFSTWLYRVASNAAISRHRSRSRRRGFEMRADDDALARLPGGQALEAEVGARLEVAALERALAALPEHYRVAVTLRDVYEMSIEEIASQLKISETAAKVRVHRGRKKLKALVFADDEGPGTEDDR